MESLSNLKYSSLGARVSSQYRIDSLLGKARVKPESLPPLQSNDGTLYNWDQNYRLLERGDRGTQEIFVNSFRESFLGKFTYDTHASTTFLGPDLKPDVIVSTVKTSSILGEAQVAFLVDLKSQGTNLDTADTIGQAASYLIRLLEASSEETRPWAFCCITNLESAIVVRVNRKQNGGWEFMKSYLVRASLGVTLCYENATGFNLSSNLSEQGLNPLKYLGGGASAFVYSICGVSIQSEVDSPTKVIKFYRDLNNGHITQRNERSILGELNNDDKPPEIVIQSVVCESSSINFPYLVLAPMGKVYTPWDCKEFSPKEAFKNLWLSLRYAHSRGIIHNDIRPENIILVESSDIWLLIDWAAAWNLPLVNKDDNDKPFDSYCGNVSCACDSILQELQDNKSLIELNGTCKVHANTLTDVISFIRMTYLFSYRISRESYNNFKKIRGENDFAGVINWWQSRLPPCYKKLEQDLIDASDIDISDKVWQFLDNALLDFF